MAKRAHGGKLASPNSESDGLCRLGQSVGRWNSVEKYRPELYSRLNLRSY